MDFNAVLSAAQKNEASKQQTVPCYQTKYTPMKKQTKQSKDLSENIKKFLARKEEEEKQKALQEKKKKENLLALRDHKAQSRINKHLKVCKSANKSVLADAIDNENTAITIAGPSQPDEDDYGYVSQSAAAFYDQLMSKYNSLPPEKPVFSNSEKRTIKDIATTKDRLKQAFKQQELGGIDGHKRKRKSCVLNEKTVENDEKTEKNVVDKDEDKDEMPKPKRKSLPPPMGFTELLQLAQKKQHEPVVIPVKPKVEEERLMTKRQMQEHIKEKERREQREKNLEVNKKPSITNMPSKTTKIEPVKVPKINEKSPSLNSISNKSSSKITPTNSKNITNKSITKHNIEKPNSNKNSSKNELLEERKKLEAERKQLEEMRRAIEEEKRKLAQSRNRQEDVKTRVKPSNNKVIAKAKTVDNQVSSKDIKPRQFPPADVKLHSSLIANKPKQFPPADVRFTKPRQNVKKPATSNKGTGRTRDDEDDEHDSDMDDFIDDGPEEDGEDYSKYISEIFGYDKKKYRHIDDEDDAVMESTFAQQLKEEYVSAKIGIMEDLEDMRMEALEKKKKVMNKKLMK